MSPEVVQGLMAVGWLLACAGLALLVRSHVRAAARAELVARAAHELRGPLFAAGLALHGLGRRGVPVGAACAELERARLALADLEAAPSGGLAVRTVDVRPVDVAELVAGHADAWRAVARAGGAALVVARPPTRRAVVEGDGLRLAQAVANLVANAAEHGGDRIDLRVAPFADRVLVEVRDDGAGLPAPLAVLRARRPRGGRSARGRGLGVVAEVAEAHGGVLADAPSARGARLVLDLPAAPDDRAAPSADPVEAPAARAAAPERPVVPAWPDHPPRAADARRARRCAW